MSLTAEPHIPIRFSLSRPVSALAAILGASGLLTLHQGYAAFPELAVPAGAGLLLGAIGLLAQGFRQQQASNEAATALPALADSWAEAVQVKDLEGKVLFANGAAKTAADLLNTKQPVRLPWHDKSGRPCGSLEIYPLSVEPPQSFASVMSQEVSSELEREVAQRTADVRELVAQIEMRREEEKKAIAKTLHGDLGSGLTALSMHLAILSKQLPEEPAFKERVKQMRDLLIAAATTVRRIQTGLRPDKLELFGLKAAAEDLAETLSQSTGIQCVLDFPDEAPTYSPEVALSLFRMLEEALRNVAAHAYATQVNIVLDDVDDELTLRIRDNGVGFAPDSLPANAHGLRSMQERAAYLGGKASVHAAPGKGTIVVITLPKHPQSEHAQPPGMQAA